MDKQLLDIYKKTTCDSKNEDSTVKYLIRTSDGNFFESVLIFEDTLTLCVSSQIGCNVKCKFCVTGNGTFRRNLTCDEILEQARIIEDDCGREIECISYMGMGEPMHNLNNVLESMKVFHSENKKIKISTVGVPGTIRKLADTDVPLDLYFSLHFANEEKRQNIIPASRTHDLSAIIEELNYFIDVKGAGITVWYLMLDGINDDYASTQDLLEFLGKIDKIKLVYVKDYCESGMGFRKAALEKLNQLTDMLNSAGIPSKISVSEGQSINAGCGQLRHQVIMDALINLQP